MKKTSKWSTWKPRLSSFSVEALFSTKHEPGPPRTVFVNEELPSNYRDHKGRILPRHVFTANQVITSKYTIITFLPRNLLEQFRRIANIFFLVLAILQFFPEFSTISPGVAILPLIIILTLTALKDGYEDYKRHQADRRVNYSKVHVLSGGPFQNPNPVHKKSKTFIRGLVPRSRKAPTEQAMAGQSKDVEAALENPHHTDREYDDESDRKPGGPHWRRVLWEDLKVGDFVKIMEDEPFPADLLICSTSDEEENVAFVETKNLDGETNLKSRNAVPVLTHLRSAKQCAHAEPFRIECDRPENNMYKLNAALELGEDKFGVDLQTVLLRGTVLRNTKWVIGIVLFTGEDTKIVMNAGGTPSKRSKVERQMNPQVLINLFIMAVLAAACGVAESTLEKQYTPRGAPWLFGNNRSDDNPNINGIITFVYAILTFQNLVPISLYLSIEVVRTLQALWIFFDKDIWYEKTNQATMARSWNLSDDLGQIEYIFSDKTGTLTQNLMVFRQCSVGGIAYRGDSTEDPDKTMAVIGEKDNASSTKERISEEIEEHRFHDAHLRADIEAAVSSETPPNAEHARALNGFFSVLALCHTVIAAVDKETGKVTYKAQSPDEAALVQAAADAGYVFLGRDKEILSLRTPSSPDPERYELLNILDFNSARKRVSVVVKKLDGADERIFLLSKGADNVIFERLKGGPGGVSDEQKEVTERHLSEFANEGLRTLTLAYKVIPPEDFAEWNERYHAASIAMEDREGKIDAMSEELERDLRLLGATAIEDKLQEGVPETIADLKRAGIKIWVATGDKLETAIAIGRSTNLIAHDSNIIIVRGGNRPVEQQLHKAMEQFFPENLHEVPIQAPARPSMASKRHSVISVNSVVGEGNGERPGGFVLVVDGAALLEAFETEERKQTLLRLATLCEGVICCRVSPLQKALIVRLVKDGLKAMTLAIGDGANDVSMIQAADVGVGISGEEGLQAVNSSDYAIAQFRFLKKLILVHGHWSFARNGIMILNFFYKNMVPTFALFWFQIYDGWSGTFAFDYVYILFWNSIWSIFPAVGIGLFDRIVDYHALMDLPELYKFGREGTWFRTRDFWIYMLDGLYQSVILYFFISYTYFTTTARSDGYSPPLYEWSTTIAVAGVMVVDIYTGLCASAWTWWLVFAVSFGIVAVWLFTIIYSVISPGYAVTSLYGNYYFLLTSAYFWLVIPITFLLCLAPRILAKSYKFGFAPDDLDIVRYLRKKAPYRDLRHESQTHLGIGLDVLKVQRRQSAGAASLSSRRISRTSSIATVNDRYDSALGIRSASRLDMSTGVVSHDRGFDFVTEEGGVAIRRIQTNLSERRLASNPHLPRPHHHHTFKGKGRSFSLKEGMRKVGSTLRKKKSPPTELREDRRESEHQE